MKEEKVLYYREVKNQDKKWYQFWKEEYIIKKHTLQVNKKGEIVVGKLLK